MPAASLIAAIVQMRRYDEALQTIDGLDATLLSAGDSTPGWQQRLDAMRGEILIERGDFDAGSKILAPALETLAKLDTDEDSEITRLRQLLNKKH